VLRWLHKKVFLKSFLKASLRFSLRACLSAGVRFFSLALWLWFTLSCLFYSEILFASLNLESLRKAVVFPAKGVDDSLLDELWWQTRELLASDGRFDVATRRLMINRQVLSPRGSLKPADSVILGRILDSDILVTQSLANKKVTLAVFRCVDGAALWQEEVLLDSSQRESDQILPIFKGLIENFLKKVPYVGYQTLSPQSQALYEPEGHQGFVFVEIPVGQKKTLGDKVYWVKVTYSGQPLLQSQLSYEILNFGDIVALESPKILKVKLQKNFDPQRMTLGSLVYGDFKENLSVETFESRLSTMGAEFLLSEVKTQKKVNEQSGVATFLGSVLGFSLLLLLAF
jgi:hypothetical protein